MIRKKLFFFLLLNTSYHSPAGEGAVAVDESLFESLDDLDLDDEDDEDDPDYVPGK